MNNLRPIECEGGFYYATDSVVVHPDAVVGPGVKLWDDVKIGANAVVGSGSILGAGVHVEPRGVLGNNCKVQRGVTIYTGVIAEDYVFFGPNSTTTNDRNPRAFGAWRESETYIEIGASVGANATLIAGNRIGALSLIGAGAVVSKSVEPGQLVAGNPARFLGWVDLSGAVISRDSQSRPAEVTANLLCPREAIEHYVSSER